MIVEFKDGVSAASISLSFEIDHQLIRDYELLYGKPLYDRVISTGAAEGCDKSCSSCENIRKCLACSNPKDCILQTGLCGACPQPFVKSADPDDFFENASLTFVVVEVKSQQKLKYRVVFSDPPLVLKSPYNLVDISEWLSVSLSGYLSPEDFTYTFSYLEATSAIDIEEGPQANGVNR